MTAPGSKPAGDGTERIRKLKVYSANLDGRNEVIAACRSLTEFRRISGAARAYIDETGNDADIAQAMRAPGTVFMRPINARDDVPWTVYLDARSAPADPCRGEGDAGTPS